MMMQIYCMNYNNLHNDISLSSNLLTSRTFTSMATTLSLSFSLDSQNHRYYHYHRRHHHHLLYANTHFKLKHPLLILHKSSARYALTLPLSSSQSPPSTSTSSYLQDPLRPGRFLSNEELEKIPILENFKYDQELESGSMWVRVMRAEEMDVTVALLSESFAESMLLPSGYVSLLRFLVKQYLIERRGLMPHAVTLVGFYRGDGEEEESGGGEQLAGTVEVSFDKRGANASPPTPTPPKNSPYICNVTVKKPLRRRGIGWHLLKASEKLISQMSSSEDVYLHCRMIDAAPFNMYTKAGYDIVKTDSILILLTLQRRKHLMCKKLPVLKSPPQMDMSGSEEEVSS